MSDAYQDKLSSHLISTNDLSKIASMGHKLSQQVEPIVTSPEYLSALSSLQKTIALSNPALHTLQKTISQHIQPECMLSIAQLTKLIKENLAISKAIAPINEQLKMLDIPQVSDLISSQSVPDNHSHDEQPFEPTPLDVESLTNQQQSISNEHEDSANADPDTRVVKEFFHSNFSFLLNPNYNLQNCIGLILVDLLSPALSAVSNNQLSERQLEYFVYFLLLMISYIYQIKSTDES
ncbi:hypothetical protein [Dolosigranulum savutiense]|uniref:Uncharacterized protein n=1 Tax=Dolosigranulum savutiense TaxID=3110288 RepID=A0AB74TZS3_9LACT